MESSTQLSKRDPSDQNKDKEVGNREKKNLEHPDSDQTWICVSGIRQFMTDYELVKEIKKCFGQANEQAFQTITHILKPKKKPLAFLKIVDEGSAQVIRNLFPISIKNRKAKARQAKFDPALLRQARTIEQVSSYIEKRQQNHRLYEPPNEEFAKALTQESVTALMREKICGYASLSYDTQIAKKSQELKEHLIAIRNIAVKESANTYHENSWIIKSTESKHVPNPSTDLPCCELGKFMECEEQNRVFYRNKNELTIGLSAPIFDGKCLPKLGFNVAVQVQNFHCIEGGQKPEDNITCPQEAFYISQIVEEIVRESGIGVWSRYLVGTGLNGFWRNLVIRLSKVTKEIVVTLVGRKAYFKQLGDDAEDSEDEQEGDAELFEANKKLGLDNCEKETIKDFHFGMKTFDNVIVNWFTKKFVAGFEACENLKGFQLVGLNFLNSDQSSDSVPFVQDNELVTLAGDSKVYHEKICGNLFEVSNSSFLQINTPMMDKMYKFVGELANIDENTLLLDICSGIGTIGLSVGQKAKKIIGIEMVESSCENAKKNAQNCSTGHKYEVICSKVEDVIDKVIAENPSVRVVGILDPPRAGLHPSVIKTLRTCRGLNELVFMACDVNQSKRNILDLCLPESKSRKGPEFAPILCTGVDMFPNSPHYETIFYLKRPATINSDQILPGQ